MPQLQLPDHVLDHITACLDAYLAGEPLPEPIGLTTGEAQAADLIVADITSTPPADIVVPPLEEDPIAVWLGIVPPPAEVLVDTDAAAAALTGADIDALLADLAHYDRPRTADWLHGLTTGAVAAACPITLRVLAALRDVPSLRADHQPPRQ